MGAHGRRLRRIGLYLLAEAGLTAALVHAQPSAVPIRFTPVVAHTVRTEIELPGTVASRTTSLVASQVAGVVLELHAREGARLAKGNVLARLDTDRLAIRLAASNGSLREAEARLRRAERVLGRATELLSGNHISPDDFDAAESEMIAWQGRVAQLSADIEGIELDITHCTITAPLGGVVVSERIEVGEWLSVGAPVVEIMSISEIEVRVDVPERTFVRLAEGEPVRVTLEALPDVQLHGTLSATIPRANERAHTFPIRVTVPNPQNQIPAGALVKVHLPSGPERDAVLVPKDAVVTQGPSRFVFVIGDDDAVARVPVVVGRGMGAWLVVEGELLADQRVVTRGNERLRPGQPVAGELLEYELP